MRRLSVAFISTASSAGTYLQYVGSVKRDYR
jgi:hypothetical protein